MGFSSGKYTVWEGFTEHTAHFTQYFRWQWMFK